MGFSELIQPLIDKLYGWAKAAVAMLPNFLLAVAIVLIAVYVAKAARALTRRGLRRVSHYEQINSLLGSLVRLAVLTAGVFFALGVLNLDRTVTSLLAGVGIVGLALGFAFQDLAANLISGVYLAFRRPFSVGELVELGSHFGVVEHIHLRATTIRRPTGQYVIIPNKEIFHSAIINFSRPGHRRVDIPVGVRYDDDLRVAQDAALQAATSVSTRDQSREAEVFYEEFGDSSINMVVRFWISEGAQKPYLAARSEAVIAIKDAFDKAGITIPFPIRTLDVPDPFVLTRRRPTEGDEKPDAGGGTDPLRH